MNKDQLIQRGLQAKELLANETLASFVEELGELIKQSIVNTKPEDWKARERLYNQHRSIEDLIGIMRSYADAADAELELLDAEALNRETD